MWVSRAGDHTVRVGITDYRQDQLSGVTGVVGLLAGR
ncbi:hypothetical protein [Streptomyces lucensis]